MAEHDTGTQREERQTFTRSMVRLAAKQAVRLVRVACRQALGERTSRVYPSREDGFYLRRFETTTPRFLKEWLLVFMCGALLLPTTRDHLIRDKTASLTGN